MLCLMCCLAVYQIFPPISCPTPLPTCPAPVSSSRRNKVENESCRISVLTVSKHLVCSRSYFFNQSSLDDT